LLVLAQAHGSPQIRAEGGDPLAVQLELLPMGVDEPAERVLVSARPRASVRSGTTASSRGPVPFVLLTGIEQSQRGIARLLLNPGGVYAHKPRSNETSTEEDMPQ
jgi:hypothetical protein